LTISHIFVIFGKKKAAQAPLMLNVFAYLNKDFIEPQVCCIPEKERVTDCTVLKLDEPLDSDAWMR
jgi:hypothetical protein